LRVANVNVSACKLKNLPFHFCKYKIGAFSFFFFLQKRSRLSIANPPQARHKSLSGFSISIRQPFSKSTLCSKTARFISTKFDVEKQMSTGATQHLLP
jgi:hypothetical protein